MRDQGGRSDGCSGRKRVRALAARPFGVIVIVSLITPYRSLRRRVRGVIPRFVEVCVKCVKCPLEVCAGRDVKGVVPEGDAG